MGKTANEILNDKFYKEQELRADNFDDSIANQLLDDFRQGKNEMQILAENNQWDILYHVSPIRKNILEWYDFDEKSSVLEIGAECGILTDVLCRKVKDVTCIESSMKKSLINAERNSRYDNLKIFVGKYPDIHFQEQFDYVILIGGLEKAAEFMNSENPFTDFLSNIYAQLREGGKLLLATENKFGIKYWAGEVEKYSEKCFEGIEGYASAKEKGNTFSKNEIKDFIKKVGFKDYTFYYPYPDYRFPEQLFSDDFLPKEDEIICSHNCYENNRIQLFDETNAIRNIIRSNEFDLFSNSFFVEATK